MALPHPQAHSHPMDRPPSLAESRSTSYAESIYPKPEPTRDYEKSSSQQSLIDASADKRQAWQDVSRAVLDMDKEKIKGCKDDMNTLLVFAGLFSAVLSAFLVESYKQLQPDNSSEIVALLRQSISQSYSVSFPFVNSTLATNAASESAFEAPISAVHLNALWFASLICSLATASIGMLVKQWLREYREMSYTSPRDQLRAWQYRFPALAPWRVFDIAAALPLLLHLSLGLFFAGLCIFAAAVDRRIGNTTLPLTLGWGVFLLATIIPPFITPRCPYNVPLLRAGQAIVRRWLLRPMLSFFRAQKIAEEIEAVKEGQTDPKLLLTIDRVLTDDGLVDSLAQTLIKEQPSSKDAHAFIREILLHRIGLSGETLPSMLSDQSPLAFNLRFLSKSVLDPCMDILAYSVDKICSTSRPAQSPQLATDTDDAIYLFLQLAHRTYPLSGKIIDVFKSDQNIQAFLESFSHSKLPPEMKVNFLYSIAQVRWKGQQLSQEPSFDISNIIQWPDLYDLQHYDRETYVWSPLLSPMADTLQFWKDSIKKHPTGDSSKISSEVDVICSWVLDATMAVLAHTSYLGHKHPAANSMLAAVPEILGTTLLVEAPFSERGETQFMGYALAQRMRPTSNRPFKPLSKQLVNILKFVSAPSQTYLLNIFHMYYVLLNIEADIPGQSSSCESLTSSRASVQNRITKILQADVKNRKILAILTDLWEFLHGYLVKCIDDSLDTPLKAYLKDFFILFRASLSFGLNRSRQRRYVGLWSLMLESKSLDTRAFFMSTIFPTEEPLGNLDLSSSTALAPMFAILKPDKAGLSSFVSTLERLAEARESTTSYSPPSFDPLRLCVTYLRLYARIFPFPMVDNNVIPAPPEPGTWARLWLVIIRHIQLYESRSGSLLEQSANTKLVQRLEQCVVALEHVFPSEVREIEGLPQANQDTTASNRDLIPRLAAFANFLNTSSQAAGPGRDSADRSSGATRNDVYLPGETSESGPTEGSNAAQVVDSRRGTGAVFDEHMRSVESQPSAGYKLVTVPSSAFEFTAEPRTDSMRARRDAVPAPITTLSERIFPFNNTSGIISDDNLPDSFSPLLHAFEPATPNGVTHVGDEGDQDDDTQFFFEGDDPSYDTEYPNQAFWDQWGSSQAEGS